MCLPKKKWERFQTVVEIIQDRILLHRLGDPEYWSADGYEFYKRVCEEVVSDEQFYWATGGSEYYLSPEQVEELMELIG